MQHAQQNGAHMVTEVAEERQKTSTVDLFKASIGRLWQFAERSESVSVFIGKIKHLSPRSGYEQSAGGRMMFSMSFLQNKVNDCVPKRLELVETVLICCCEDPSGETPLLIHNSNGIADSDRSVLKNCADRLCDASLYGKARAVPLCLRLEHIIQRRLG